MGARAEDLRQDIAEERRELAQSIEAIGDRVSPGRIVERRANRLRGRVQSMRSAVMGVPPALRADGAGLVQSAQDVSRSAGEHVSSTAQGIAGAVTGAPDQVAAGTRGNPLAAGLIAFGAGLVTAAVLPKTEREERIGEKAAELVKPAVDEVRSLGEEAVADLRPAAAEAAEHVKDAAMEGLSTVKEASASGARSVAAAGAEAVDETRAAGAGGSLPA